MVSVSNNHYSSYQELICGPYYIDEGPIEITLQSLGRQLSGSLTYDVYLLDQFLHDEPTPQKMAELEWALSEQLREVGHVLWRGS